MKKVFIKFINLLMLIVFSTVVISGCSYSIGSVQSSWGGKIDASYVTLNDQKEKSIKLKGGEILVLDYKVTVKKGALTINVTGPDKKELWEVKFTEDGADTVEIPAEMSGKYIITIIGEKTGGGYHIKTSKK